ncbi:MAG TPA: KH domain-containing protein [Candidatus Eisenbacteria bacterium]|jgi:predicted RNA-binding protein YlqC (UPF0109 family)|nr:KH domain-containing protein [Candidatus Eisenbacteria bacterium]
MAARDLVEYVAKSLVDDPDAVQVVETRDEDGTVIELHVAEDDMGKVIGRNGSVAKALRTLLKVSAARQGGSVTLEIL